MNETTQEQGQAVEAGSWHAPEVEVICLACEISAYAPDEDGQPLF